jgi:hypothetical protein
MLKTLIDLRRWFIYVNQRLGKFSVKRMNWDRLKISKNARREERKFHSQRISRCQLGNDMRLLQDLEDFQEGSRSIPY